MVLTFSRFLKVRLMFFFVPKYVLNLFNQDEEFEEILPEESNADCDENAYGYLYSYEKDYKMFCFD
jgi:hypothetical protein